MDSPEHAPAKIEYTSQPAMSFMSFPTNTVEIGRGPQYQVGEMLKNYSGCDQCYKLELDSHVGLLCEVHERHLKLFFS